MLIAIAAIMVVLMVAVDIAANGRLANCAIGCARDSGFRGLYVVRAVELRSLPSDRVVYEIVFA